MPRVEQRKARKDYPAHGIAKGDTYYYTKLKMQRGGIVKRSKTPFKPSQLTNSSFKSGFLAAGEGWEASSRDADAMREAAEAVRETGNEAQESFDNMPEGLQAGETGQQLENRAAECERIADELEQLAEELEGLEEPDKPEEPEGGEPDDDEAPDFLAKSDAWETYQDDLAQYESDLDDHNQEIERIPSDADSLLGDMPE